MDKSALCAAAASQIAKAVEAGGPGARERLNTWINDGGFSADWDTLQGEDIDRAYPVLKTLLQHVLKKTGPFKPSVPERVNVLEKPAVKPSGTPVDTKPPAKVEKDVSGPFIDVEDTGEVTDRESRLIAALRDAIGKPKASVDRGEVKRIAEEAVERAKEGIAKRIEIVIPNREAVVIEKQHFQFETILQLAGLGENILLSGPAGSGKTTVAEKVAETLKLPFWPQSVGAQTSKGDLMGIPAPEGYRPSPLRQCYEFGGVWLIDELDAGHAGVLTIVNQALANGICGFPDKTVKRHPDFICIAAANTWGHGANSAYCGRNQLDAATLDRFARLPFDYDESLERELAGNNQWVDRVQAIRKAVFGCGAKVIVSPRASIMGARMLAAGMDQSLVEDVRIWNGVDRATKEKVLSHVN